MIRFRMGLKRRRVGGKGASLKSRLPRPLIGGRLIKLLCLVIVIPLKTVPERQQAKSTGVDSDG